MIDSVLVYPRLGSMDTVVADLPLSIVYAATEAVRRKQDIQLIDLRCRKGDWREALKPYLDQGVRLLGVSVMTGMPLYNAKDISTYVRRHYPETKIVWGGPHVTILPETINEPYIDFLVRGYGSRCLAELIDRLKAGNTDYADIRGLSYKREGKVFHNDREPCHEIIPFRDLPYHLIDIRDPAYRRVNTGNIMFTMFSSIGCPYKCSFCVHPTIYKIINPPKWLPLPEAEVVDHMAFAVKEFQVRDICFIDDTSFPDLGRMKNIFEMIIERRLDVNIEFRGARINELDKMDDEFIQLMIKAGTSVLKVGAESGSNRMLKIFNKQISQDQIIRVNRKFAQYPELTMDYNFFCGAPGETYEDLRETKEVVLQIIRENRNAYYSYGADWKPIPGSVLLKVAEDDYGFKVPQTLEEWAEMDSFDSKKKIVHPWYTRKHNNLIKAMQLSGFVIDDKVLRETAANKSFAFRLIRFLAAVYKPIIVFRLRHDIYAFMIEYNLYRLALNIFSKLQTV